MDEEEIRVVKVDKQSHAGFSFFVHFSEPVWLKGPDGDYWIGPDIGWWCESDATDKLGAFQWGLEVIKEHKRLALLTS